MKKLLFAFAFSATGAWAQPASPGPVSMDFTPRQLYVSCSLLLSGDRLVDERILGQFKPIAPATCGGSIVRALAMANDPQAEEDFRFCANGTAAFDADVLKSAALIYVEFYEARAERLNKVSGFGALIIALKAKWPCS